MSETSAPDCCAHFTFSHSESWVHFLCLIIKEFGDCSTLDVAKRGKSAILRGRKMSNNCFNPSALEEHYFALCKFNWNKTLIIPSNWGTRGACKQWFSPWLLTTFLSECLNARCLEAACFFSPLCSIYPDLIFLSASLLDHFSVCQHIYASVSRPACLPARPSIYHSS